MTLYHDVAGVQTQTDHPDHPRARSRPVRPARSAPSWMRSRIGTAAPVPTSQILYNQAIIDHIVKSAAVGHEVEVEIPEI